MELQDAKAIADEWDQVLKQVHADYVDKLGPKVAHKKLAGARHFLEWVEAQGLTLDQARQMPAKKVLADFKKAKSRLKQKDPFELAKALLAKAIGEAEEPEAEEPDESEVPTDEPKEEPEEKKMKTRQPRRPEEEEEEVSEDEVEYEDEDEAPPSKRRRAAPPTQFIAVPASAMRRPAGRVSGAPLASKQSRLVQPTRYVNIYKRQRGKKVLIGMYSDEDIIDGLKAFILDNIHEEQCEPGPDPTTYLVYPCSSKGVDVGDPAVISLAALNMGDTSSPVSVIRDTVELVRDLRQEGAQEQNELLERAKEQQLERGDTTGLMHLMLMERMLGKQSDPTEMALKLADKLVPKSEPRPEPFPNFPGYMPPAPPPPPAHGDVFEQMMKMMLMRALEPPKSLGDQLKEMMLLKEFMGGGAEKQSSSEVSALRLEVQQLAQAIRSGTINQPPPGSLEGAMNTFAKVKDVVTTLAPQINAGGLVENIKAILSPDLMKAIGDTAAGAISKAQAGQTGAGPAKQLPAPAQQPPKPPPLPPEVVAAQAALRNAKGVEEATGAMLDYLQVLYFGIANAELEPVMKELMAGKVDNGRRVVAALLVEVRKDLVSPAFCDEVLRRLYINAIAAGMVKEMPKELGGAPVKELPKPVAAPPAAPPALAVAPPPPSEALAAQIAAVEAGIKPAGIEAVKFEKQERPLANGKDSPVLDNVLPIQLEQPAEKVS